MYFGIAEIFGYKGQSGRDVLVLWGVYISGLFRLWDGLNELSGVMYSCLGCGVWG